MQNSFEKFSMACDNFGLTISKKKTEVIHQPAPGKPYVKHNITIKDQRLKVVEKFTYLSSTHSKSIIMDDKVNTRLTKASAAFSRPEATKIKVYRAVVLTTLLYGCKTWTTYQQHIKKLTHFHVT